MVQSALDSFYIGIREGRLHTGLEEDLAGLLATITIRKVRQKVVFHKARKRSIDREQELPPVEDEPPPQLWALARELSPFMDVALKEELEVVLDQLSDLHREMIHRTMDGQSTRQVAKATGRTEGMVRVVLRKTETKLRRRLADFPEP